MSELPNGDDRAQDEESVENSLKDVSAAVLTASIADRQCYQHALLGRWSALDAKAKMEMFQFTVAVTSLR